MLKDDSGINDFSTMIQKNGFVVVSVFKLVSLKGKLSPKNGQF